MAASVLNAVGLLRKTVDPLGRETEMTYDALLRLSVKKLPTVTLPDGTTARYEEHYEYGTNAGSGAFTILCGDAKGKARSSPRTPKDGHDRGRLD